MEKKNEVILTHNIDAILLFAQRNGIRDIDIDVDDSISRLVALIDTGTSLKILLETDRLLAALLSAKTLDITWKLLLYKALKKARALAVAREILRHAPPDWQSRVSLTELYCMSRGHLENLLRAENDATLFKRQMLFDVDSIITDGIACANPLSYREYRLKKCRPCGWQQVNNDCWLSGFMYAAFASDVIAPFFSAALDRMWASDSQELRSLAVQLSRFLAAIDNPQFPGQCIVGIKQEIYGAMDAYQKKADFMDAWSTAMEDEVSVSGDGTVGRGSVQPLLKLFSHVGSDSIALEMKFTSGCDIISTVLGIIAAQGPGKKVFIINFDGMDPARCYKTLTPTNRTALETAVAAKTGWTLQSVIYGNDNHYWVDARCGGTWSSYNGITVGPTRAWETINLTGFTLFFASDAVVAVPVIDAGQLA